MKFILFGTGKNADLFISSIQKEDIIVEIWDNNQEKHGTYIDIKHTKIGIVAPHKIADFLYDKIIIASSYYDEMKDQLLQLGILNEKIDNKYYIYKRAYLTSNNDLFDIKDYLSSYELDFYNYDHSIYNINDISVYYDDSKSLYYVIHNGHRLYMSRKMNNEHLVRLTYNLLRIEGDENCPHCYENFIPSENQYDLLIDLGGAEGIFSLNHITQAKKIIIVEADNDWVEALKYTFEDFKEKVEIISKYCSDTDDDNNCTINKLCESFTNSSTSVLLKMDIEGFEEKVLSKSDNLDYFRNVEIICCTYHHYTAEENIAKILESRKFRLRKSKTKMFFPPEEEQNTLLLPESYNKSIYTMFRTALLSGKREK